MHESTELPGLLLAQAQPSIPTNDSGVSVFVRRFVTAVVLSHRDALAVGEWLVENATALLESREAGKAHD